MHLRKARAVLSVACALMFSPIVSGAYQGLLWENRSPSFPIAGHTYFVLNLWASFSSPTDRLLSVTQADIWFMNGHNFFQHPFGTATAPNSAFFPLPGFQALPYDSFVTIGLKSIPVGGTDSTALEPGTAFLNPAQPTAFAGGWYNSNPDNDQGVPGAHGVPTGSSSGTFYVLLAQLSVQDPTFATSLFGGHFLVAWQSFGGPVTFSPAAFQSTLSPPPAPGAIPLLAIAALAGRRRRA